MRYPIPSAGKVNKIKFAQLEAASRENIPVLTSDIIEFCRRIRENEHDETSARAAVRCYISLAEAILYYMRGLSAILIEHHEIGKTISPKERELLLGVAPDIRKGKSKKTPPRREAFLEKVKFTLKIYPKLFDINFPIDYTNEGWQKLVIARDIRHRLTHPQKAGDVRLTGDEYDTVAKAAQWLHEQYKNIEELKHERIPLKTTPQ